VTDQYVNDFPYYRSPDSIRNEAFSHRMRGVDEAEVREYLDMLADQIQAADKERAAVRAENERLRTENARLRRDEPQGGAQEISADSIALFSHAQQVADQLVEEAVVHARDLMASARLQQREILQQAHDAAATAAHGSTGANAALSSLDYTTPIPEIEYVRTFTRVAQAQLRSVLEALGHEVDKLDEAANNFGDPDELSQARMLEASGWHHPA
jgi:cell division initiation protein